MEILKDKIPKNIFQRLEIAEIFSLDYLLLKSKQEICDKTRLSNRDVTKLINVVSEIILNHNFITVTDLKNQTKIWSVLNTGCNIIDKTTKGIPTIGITEIYGESGAGKTQISLQLALQVQKQKENGGLDSGAVYICTEDSFPSKRLQQIIEYLPKNDGIKYSDNIFIEQIQDIEQLKYCISIRVPVLLAKTKIKLILIDSITAVFRYDNESNDHISRSEDLRFLATKLNNLSTSYNLAIVCINQVTSDPQCGIKPCLGLSWSNLVRKRIKLSRSSNIVTVNNQMLPLRHLKVIFSPDVPPNSCSFVITNAGVTGLNK